MAAFPSVGQARVRCLAAGILTVRTPDQPLCAVVPFWVHFIQPMLNVAMPGRMIEVFRRHSLAAGGARG